MTSSPALHLKLLGPYGQPDMPALLLMGGKGGMRLPIGQLCTDMALGIVTR
eukprot:CAMPEP_0204544780 /NCGR_PEP_ID=MMETSP0661-20131031/20796_1 /ASSEMBLY_ACC=CAM_ASM_000606 /TAXON_ID=109239 /ORGANISM="Alexandrium margalefi, Strain AMGDE01CS-322" /LENGTH=50 /DNA_ID=CAMNT_0051551559 /DNA_START=110 /DNA_END=257 /DNA_ORIENTATION=-